MRSTQPASSPLPVHPVVAARREAGLPVIGVAYGSGAARGWAHVGVMDALAELGVEVHVQAGCSVGALVPAARALGIWDEFLSWAKTIGGFHSLSSFALGLGSGGLVNPDAAFEAFRGSDRNIEDLPAPFGAVATDLATGQEVWLTRGSVLDACRASSAIPMLLHAACHKVGDQERWLIDGAASNPVPVSLARALGADRVIAVDLNSVSRTLARFDRPKTRAVVPVERRSVPGEGMMPGAVANFLRDTRDVIDREIAMARAKSDAKPHFFETVIATLDIVQTQLSKARAQVDLAELRLAPDMHDASPTAFDRFDDYRQIGYDVAMAKKEEILALASPHPLAEDLEPVHPGRERTGGGPRKDSV
ncbi:patatin-like phospholipase family protein [Parvularcula oceani]|uniref:patatin-like phospholipase family protein n=1 Tax=Parvularcula oceani TaxID=1247963 RepID=UPI00068D641C|nr:patatin-like phospholipase family protein [Parvularcula oceani]